MLNRQLDLCGRAVDRVWLKFVATLVGRTCFEVEEHTVCGKQPQKRVQTVLQLCYHSGHLQKPQTHTHANTQRDQHRPHTQTKPHSRPRVIVCPRVMSVFSAELVWNVVFSGLYLSWCLGRPKE